MMDYEKKQVGIPQQGDDCPEDKYLNKYVRDNVCAANPDVWRDLGITLMGQSGVLGLDIIKADNKGVVMCCSAMFNLWRQRQPKANWNQLIKALKEVKLETLAGEIEALLLPPVQNMQQLDKSSYGVMLSPTQASQTPSEQQILLLEPKMHELNKFVIEDIQAYWEDVAYALEYEIRIVENINLKHKGDPKRCCQELLKSWLTTSHGVGPRNWLVLLEKINEVSALATVRKTVLDKLTKKKLISK